MISGWCLKMNFLAKYWQFMSMNSHRLIGARKVLPNVEKPMMLPVQLYSKTKIEAGDHVTEVSGRARVSMATGHFLIKWIARNISHCLLGPCYNSCCLEPHIALTTCENMLKKLLPVYSKIQCCIWRCL